jgi:hypothetical protein
MKQNDVHNWDGVHPPKTSDCPFSIEFNSKPNPSNTLNSTEVGRAQLDVVLKGNSNLKVSKVTAYIINHSKEQVMLESKEQISETSNWSTLSKVVLNRKGTSAEDQFSATVWTGELSIPGNWAEEGSRTFSRSIGGKNQYSLHISYKLQQGKVCKARFESTDAFHWTI